MDINKATAEQLQQAFQVDGHRAEYIIQKRDQLGGFSNWDDVKREVPGFEDKMVENLQAAGLRIGSHQSGKSSDASERSESDSGERRSTEHRTSEHRSAEQHSAHNSSENRNSRGMNINEASADELKRAFQVDGQRADYIVSKRSELGGFKSWEQFKQVVPGFEDKMVENLEEAGFTLENKNAA